MKQLSYLTLLCLCAFSFAQSTSDRLLNGEIYTSAYSDELISGESYIITVIGSGKVLDIFGGSTVSGANLIQYTLHGGLNQQFKFETLADGVSLKITAVNSGLALDVNGGSTASGANVIQWPYFGGLNQQWTVTTYASCWEDEEGNSGCGINGYSFASVSSGLLLSVEGGSNDNEARFVQSTDENDYSFFRLTRV